LQTVNRVLDPKHDIKRQKIFPQRKFLSINIVLNKSGLL